jgi:ribulose-phosphate 3-epimerase
MVISASILNSDLCNIEKTVRLLEKNNINSLHFDVMDGVFVDNISFGVPVLQSVRKITDMFLDVHLMIVNPMRHIEKFAEAGADLITFHREVCENEKEAELITEKIHSCGKKAGIAINPGTSADIVLRYGEIADLILVMSVEPGKGGQAFMRNSLEKLKLLSDYRREKNLSYQIQVDGGINDKTAKEVISAGADNLVSGSYLIGALEKQLPVNFSGHGHSLL